MLTEDTGYVGASNIWHHHQSQSLIVWFGLSAVVLMDSRVNGCARLRSGTALVLSMGLTAAIVAMLLVSQGVSAATGPKQVRGYVTDVEGNFVQGIPLTINIRWASDDTVRATISAVSDEDGYFSETFEYSQWDVGDSIQVIATHDGNQVDESVTATDFPYQWCNVSFNYEIPEFGSVTGLLIAGGLIAAVAVVLLVSKGRK